MMAERKNLGRGLSALLGEEDDDDEVTVPAPSAPASAPDSVSDSVSVSVATPPPATGQGADVVAIEHLHPGKYQPRHSFGEAELDELAASIKDKGVLQPLLVRPHPDHTGEYEIIAGERRWQASQRAQLHEVPVLIRDLDDQETLEVALVENLQRKDLSALEEAEGYKRLMDEFSHTQEVLSDVIGKSRSHVANMLRLLSLPLDVKNMMDEGQLSAGHGRALLGASDPSAVAKKVIKKDLNVRQTERLVKGKSTAKKKAPPAKDADTRALEHDLGNLLGLRVDIQSRGQKGSIAFHYESLEQLDDLLHRLSHDDSKK